MIRNFHPSDIDPILDIWFDASCIAHNFIPKEFWQSKMDDMKNVYIPASETYVFEEKGIIKGFLSLCDDTLAAIFVAPAEQGLGIGTKLITKAMEIRKDLNLTVYKENIKSIGFYEKFGVKIVKEQIDKNTGHPEFLMEYHSKD